MNTELNSGMSDAWLKYGLHLLRELGLDLNSWVDSIRDLSFAAIGREYTLCLLKEAERSGYDDTELALALGMEKVAIWRWRKQGRLPRVGSFFGAIVLVLEKEYSNCCFPSLQEARWHMVRRLLADIAEKRFERDVELPCRNAVACTQCFFDHPKSEVFIPSESSNSPDREKLQVYVDVSRRLNKRLEGMVSVKEVSQSVSRWAAPFLLLFLGHEGWDFYGSSR